MNVKTVDGHGFRAFDLVIHIEEEQEAEELHGIFNCIPVADATRSVEHARIRLVIEERLGREPDASVPMAIERRARSRPAAEKLDL